jgi:adenylate kinase
MLNIVLFGPPGSGKGTQSANIIEKYKLVHLSTGDILRKEISEKTPLGLEAKKRMDKGELVSDDIVIAMIGHILDTDKSAKGFIFDGFPRTTPQAEALDGLLEKRGTSIKKMLALNVDKQELINRLLNRGKDSGRADDQTLSIIENRISIYLNETAIVADYYKHQGKLQSIDGMGSVEDIFARLCVAIDN